MNAPLCLTLLALLAAASARADPTLRYSVEEHPVVTAVWPDQGGRPASNTVQLTNSATFKLNTERGAVWRLESNRFVRVEGPDLGGRDDGADWKTRRMLGRLSAVIIPEMAFKSEPFTNILAVLENKIREQEPAFRIGPDHFLALAPPDEWYAGSLPEVTFTARCISAYSAVKILASVCGLTYDVHQEVLRFSPSSCDEGAIEHRGYRVSPDLRERCRFESITNVLEELGMRPFPAGCGCSYLPESDELFVAHTGGGHRELRELLYRNQLLPPELGRFRLRSVSGDDGPTLWLIDQKTGETWLYESILCPGRRWESFTLRPAD